MTTIVASSAVARADGLRAGWVAIDGERIIEMGDGAGPRGALDLGDRVVAPGFVDLQCNGVGTVDFATADGTRWRAARRALARHGTTALCATFVTANLDRYDAMLTRAAAAASTTGDGEAALLGVHLEGPFLGAAPGAHDPALLRRVDVDWLRALLDRHPGLVRMVTLAPEADPGFAGTRMLASVGVLVALGHTRASYDEALAAAAAGATCVTHLFNGMGPWHHRAPGVAGAALADGRLTPTVIADLVHVHPAALRTAFAATAAATVSDAVAVAPGNGSGPVERDGAAWLPDGTLAGATTLLDGALVHLVAAGVEPLQALRSVTVVPARLLGATDRGELRVGAVADLVVLDPATLALERVWLRGDELARDDR